MSYTRILVFRYAVLRLTVPCRNLIVSFTVSMRGNCFSGYTLVDTAFPRVTVVFLEILSQIGIKADWRAHQGRLVLFLGNKNTAPLVSVQALMMPPSHLKIELSVVPETIPPRAQVIQVVIRLLTLSNWFLAALLCILLLLSLIKTFGY